MLKFNKLQRLKIIEEINLNTSYVKVQPEKKESFQKMDCI